MIELCSPKFKQEGVPESVCDPTMGTGGFLSSYVKYYKQKYEGVPINWKLQQAEIHGCDTDMKVAGIARMNLFMETNGHNCENLKTFDSLHNDLTPFTYDIILANMPFGLKGIKYTDCSKRIKSLGINGTKSEPLFLQLMMVSLKLFTKIL
jgi:type I restriction-modification system DNA methylase subunit